MASQLPDQIDAFYGNAKGKKGIKRHPSEIQKIATRRNYSPPIRVLEDHTRKNIDRNLPHQTLEARTHPEWQ